VKKRQRALAAAARLPATAGLEVEGGTSALGPREAPHESSHMTEEAVVVQVNDDSEWTTEEEVESGVVSLPSAAVSNSWPEPVSAQPPASSDTSTLPSSIFPYARPPDGVSSQGVVHKIVTNAAALKADLSRDGSGYRVLHGAVSKTLAAAVDRDCLGIHADDFGVMINHAKVETFERQGKTLPSLLGCKDGRGERFMMKCFYNHPVPPPCLMGPQSAAFCELASLGAAVQHGLNHVFPGRFHTVVGPTVLRSFGRCRRQLVHIDKLRPQLMDESCPAASVLVALRDAQLVMYPGSHRHLPDEEGGKLTAPIEPLILSLRAGDVLVFRQDVAHAGAASTGTELRHRWHWYIDGGVPDAKERVFVVHPLTRE